MNKLFNLTLAVLLIAQGAQAENTGNGTVTLAVQEILSNKNDNLSVEERIYQRWQEAEGRRVPLQNYTGCYAGLRIINSENAILYSTALIYFQHFSAQKALDIMLKPQMTTAASWGTPYDFDENYMNIIQCHNHDDKGIYYPRVDLNNSFYLPSQSNTGTMITSYAGSADRIDTTDGYHYEYREIAPGVLSGVLFTQQKDGLPGHCPWSEKKPTEWGGKRKNYHLPNVCDITLVYVKR
ncbi:MAG: hypothetical protein V4596_02565 [Bdellovibrionota bacterium]